MDFINDSFAPVLFTLVQNRMKLVLKSPFSNTKITISFGLWVFVNRTEAKLLTCKAIKLDNQLNIELFSAVYEYIKNTNRYDNT